MYDLMSSSVIYLILPSINDYYTVSSYCTDVNRFIRTQMTFIVQYN